MLHDVNMAARFCDEILALHCGKLIARGGPEDIVAPDQLQAIYETRMGVMRHPDSGLPLAYPRS
ncbi:Iron(3+)-hydroxamate import ATP-binding protein FhuC (fragment) [Agrobacterium fabacearum CFBP 5771]